MFDFAPNHQGDPIELTLSRAREDTRSNKLDLSIGVLRDASGNTPIMECVLDAEKCVFETQASKGYLSPAGNMKYCRLVETLLLGENSPALTNGRIRSVQTPGAGAALRVVAELVKIIRPASKIWFSNPIWDHNPDFFTRAGLSKATYDYYDLHRHHIDFDAMLASLERASENDLIVFHGSCHNPTGADLTLQQWKELADFLSARRLTPLIDVAYQGFGDGIEEDVAGLRVIAENLPNAFVVTTSSKSFGLYRERAGMLSMLTEAGGKPADDLFNHVIDIVRALYFMPPDHGAAVVAQILDDSQFKKRWENELEETRQSLVERRVQAADIFSETIPNGDFNWLKERKGMFSCLPITEDNRLRMEKEEAIYMMPGGRINLGALDNDAIFRLVRVLPNFLSLA